MAVSPTAYRAVGGRTTRRIGKAGKPGRARWSSPSRVRRTSRADRMPAEARRGLSVGEVIPRVAHGVGEGVSLDVPVRIARTGKQPGDLTPRPPGVRHKRQQPGDRTTRISDHELFTRSSPANEISRSRAHIAKFDGLHEAVLARDVILSPDDELSRSVQWRTKFEGWTSFTFNTFGHRTRRQTHISAPSEKRISCARNCRSSECTQLARYSVQPSPHFISDYLICLKCGGKISTVH